MAHAKDRSTTQRRCSSTKPRLTGPAALRVPRAGDLRIGSYADFILYQGDIRRGSLDQWRIRTVAKAGVLFVHNGHWIDDR